MKRWPVGALESQKAEEKEGINGAERDRIKYVAYLNRNNHIPACSS